MNNTHTDNAASTGPKHPAESPEKEIDFLCIVLDVVVIGDLKCGPGHETRLPEKEAKALEKLGFVRIAGI